jgi:hypothetical protein
MVYALQCDPNQLFVINGSSPSTNSSITLGDYCPFKIEINSKTNKLYVTAYFDGGGPKNIQTKVVDGLTGEVHGEIPGYSIMAINEHANLIYLVADKVYESRDAANDILVLDGNSDEIVKVIDLVPVVKTAISFAVNPKIDTIYAIMYTPGHPSDPVTLIAVDGRDPLLAMMNQTLDVSAAEMAVNEETDKIYVVNMDYRKNDTHFDGSISVIDSTGLKNTISIPHGINPEAITVDSQRNRIYFVAVAGGLGGENVHVIDGNTDRLIGKWVIPNPGGWGYSIDINPTTNTIYVNSWQSPSYRSSGVRAGVFIIDADTEPFTGLSTLENIYLLLGLVVTLATAITIGTFIILRRVIKR